MKHGSQEYFDHKIMEAVQSYQNDMQLCYGLPNADVWDKCYCDVAVIPEFSSSVLSENEIPITPSINRITFIRETFSVGIYSKFIWVRA